MRGTVDDARVIAELVVGAALVVVSVPVTADWRGTAVRYSDFADLIQPYRSRRAMRRGKDPGVDWRRYVMRNRLVFGVLGCIGAALVITSLTLS